MNYTKHQNFYELRFLLHGIREEYNSDKPLYITSQENSFWEKIACKTIESWRIVPRDLANILSKDWCNVLNIQEITPKNIISDLSPESIKASDFPSTEEKEELLSQILLAKKEELWKKIPLHETVDGKFVSIDNQTYLENPNYSCDDKLRNIIKIIKSTSNLQQNLIPLWTPEAAINIIIQQPNIGHFYLLVLELIPEASNELKQTLKKLKWLPSRSGGGMTYPKNVVNLAIKELSDKLEDELEYVFVTENSKYVILSKLNVEKKYVDVLNTICSDWYDNNILKFLLSETSQTHEYCNLILKTLKLLQDRKQTISKENIDLLRNKLWLVDSRGKAIGINKIIYFPALSDEFTNILTQLKSWNYVTPKMLNEEININFCLEDNQLQDLFCTNKDAIREVGNALNQLPNYHIGDFDIDSFPINEFIQVFKDFTELPALALREKISEGDFQKFILPNLLKPINNHDKLIKILQWIHVNYQKPSKETILVYNKYLEIACKDLQVFAKEVLPKIQLLNQHEHGQWKLPYELCDYKRNTGIDTRYLLHTQQRQILSIYLDNSIPLRNISKSVEIISETESKKSKAEILQEYFRHWLNYINSEAIGAFLCVLSGTDIEVKNLAKNYLRRRDFNDLKEQLLWSHIAKEKNLSVCILSSDSDFIEVKNLFNDLINVPKSLNQLPSHIFIGELTPNSTEIIFIDLSKKELAKNKLKEILLTSIKILIEKVYGTQTNYEPLNQIWKHIDESKQLEIEAAKYFIIKNLNYIFRSLRVENSQIKEKLNQWEEEEYKLATKNIKGSSYSYTNDKIKEIIHSLQDIIYNQPLVKSNILESVRRQISQSQYGYKFSNIPFELFQNADDAVGELQKMYGNNPFEPERFTYILDWDSEYLRVMHWGRPINCFTHPNIADKDFKKEGFERDLTKMLCFNISDKSEDTTGKFGLGFKTVHLVSKEPIVISDDLCFSIHAGLLPFALEDLELERQLRDKLQSQQPSSGITDGTLINLKIDTDVITNVHEIISDFEEKISLLLVFSKFIKTCKFISNSSLQQSLTWTPIKVLGIPGIEFGKVTILNKTHNLLCFRIEDATVAIALPENFADKTSPLSNFPTFWVTTPTKETLSLRFLLNAMFDVTTGRTSLDRNSQRNIELASKIGQGLADKLDQLFKESRSNWEALRDNLEIKEADEYTFWEFLWNVLVVDWLKNSTKNNIEDATQKLIKEAFGGEYCSMGYLIASHPALPNGLYGKLYRQLVRLEKIRYVVEGILAKEEYFEKVVNWRSFQRNCQPSHVVCNTVWQDVKKLLNKSDPSDINKLRFTDVLKWELGNKQVSPKKAVALDKIVNRDFLKQLQSTQSHTKEYDYIKTELQDVYFLSQDNSYVLACKLLVKNNSEEERLLAAFAPESRLLHCDYTDTNLDFFLACREQRETIEPDEMVKWAVAAHTKEKEQAVREYLVKGERKQIFITALQASNTKAWMEEDRGIKEIFNINYQKENVQKVIRGEISWNELNSSSEDESQNQTAPENSTSNTNKTLKEIYIWWETNHVTQIEKYNQRLYPMGIDELEQKLQNRDRSAWLMLFFLGATHTMGRTKHEQHRNFIKFCLDKGWWDTFSKPNSGNLHREWMSVLDDYMESQSDDTQWYYWMEKYPTIYRIASYLDNYITSFLSVEHIQEDFNLKLIVAPRVNPAFQGGGADAPPLRLGIGANFIVRELVRLNIVEPTNYVIPHCFVPRANVRRLFTRLGCSELNIPDYQNSTKIHDFLIDRLNLSDLPAATFHNSFDIPFELCPENLKNSLQNNLSAADFREDGDFYKEEEN